MIELTDAVRAVWLDLALAEIRKLKAALMRQDVETVQ